MELFDLINKAIHTGKSYNRVAERYYKAVNDDPQQNVRKPSIRYPSHEESELDLFLLKEPDFIYGLDGPIKIKPHQHPDLGITEIISREDLKNSLDTLNNLIKEWGYERTPEGKIQRRFVLKPEYAGFLITSENELNFFLKIAFEESLIPNDIKGITHNKLIFQLKGDLNLVENFAKEKAISGFVANCLYTIKILYLTIIDKLKGFNFTDFRDLLKISVDDFYNCISGDYTNGKFLVPYPKKYLAKLGLFMSLKGFINFKTDNTAKRIELAKSMYQEFHIVEHSENPYQQWIKLEILPDKDHMSFEEKFLEAKIFNS